MAVSGLCRQRLLEFYQGAGRPERVAQINNRLADLPRLPFEERCNSTSAPALAVGMRTRCILSASDD